MCNHCKQQQHLPPPAWGSPLSPPACPTCLRPLHAGSRAWCLPQLPRCWPSSCRTCSRPIRPRGRPKCSSGQQQQQQQPSRPPPLPHPQPPSGPAPPPSLLWRRPSRSPMPPPRLRPSPRRPHRLPLQPQQRSSRGHLQLCPLFQWQGPPPLPPCPCIHPCGRRTARYRPPCQPRPTLPARCRLRASAATRRPHRRLPRRLPCPLTTTTTFPPVPLAALRRWSSRGNDPRMVWGHAEMRLPERVGQP